MNVLQVKRAVLNFSLRLCKPYAWCLPGSRGRRVTWLTGLRSEVKASAPTSQVDPVSKRQGQKKRRMQVAAAGSIKPIDTHWRHLALGMVFLLGGCGGCLYPSFSPLLSELLASCGDLRMSWLSPACTAKLLRGIPSHSRDGKRYM